MTPGKLWVGLAVLFLAGALTGIAGATLYHQYEQEHRWERGPAAKHDRIMKRLTSELALTPAQQADIEPIVSRTHVEILQLRFLLQPEVEQALTKGMAEMKTKLSVEQQEELDDLYAKLQRHWQVSHDYLRAAQERMK
ncbi:MAG: hypothetical protein KGS09_00115 [Nitrospirae bacterium]|nr:hypothetical protein [Nitrospirota bacterium]MBU6478933.1 hypothetical protein [Nitrospirota bacterium]MDE3039239.1 hypothetical protein [Nitrospirota bacterium]MDE3049995.1 hypothetical protein [Nitrospirota bacterium]MDE3221472.1 hypothetical protein [Nitrospirota bacterium]